MRFQICRTMDRSDRVRYLMYTDACLEGVAGVVINMNNGRGIFWADDVGNLPRFKFEHRETQITALELICPLICFATFPEILVDCQIDSFVDNDGASYILRKGFSKSEDRCMVAAKTWSIVAKARSAFFVWRVPSKDNPIDGASRNDFEIPNRYGWERREIVIPETLQRELTVVDTAFCINDE